MVSVAAPVRSKKASQEDVCYPQNHDGKRLKRNLMFDRIDMWYEIDQIPTRRELRYPPALFNTFESMMILGVFLGR